MQRFLLVLLCFGLACGGDDEPEPGPTACGQTQKLDNRGADHVAEPEPITYSDHPPSSGPHRPQWARWGRYSALGPEHWIHNLEHGGIVFLYRSQDGEALKTAFEMFAASAPQDGGGPFRYILTPYEALPTPGAVVAWEWTYLADRACPAEIQAFVDAHYRKAPEDVAAPGAFFEGWIGE